MRSIALASAALAATVAAGAPGTISTVAGRGTPGFSGDGGPAKSARLQAPAGIAVDQLGNIYVADTLNNRVRRVDVAGEITTIAGNGEDYGSLGAGSALARTVGRPRDVAVDPAGNIYVVQDGPPAVRRISRGTITTILAAGGVVDGRGIAVGADGTVYVADAGRGRVLAVSPSGASQTLHSGLDRPQDVAVDPAGRLLVAEASRVRRFSKGAVATVASGGAPRSLTVDAKGIIYVADAARGVVEKIAPGGRITTIAGGGSSPAEGIPATKAVLHPAGVATDVKGNLYVSEDVRHRVREVVLEAQPPPPPKPPPGKPPKPGRPPKPTPIEFASAGVVCSIFDDGSRRAHVHCRSPRYDAVLKANGTLAFCAIRRGRSCGTFAIRPPISVGAGSELALGRFSCVTLPGAVWCVLRRTGHGFMIGPAGLRAVR